VQITNVAGGVVAGSFIAAHPLSVYLSTIGVSDAAFTCLVSLTTLAGMALARSPSWPRTAVLGLLLGFGTSTKLSPIAIAVLLAGVGIAFAATPVLQRIPAVRSLLKLVPGIESPNVARLSWKLVTLPLIAGFYFVLTYPYLWPAPLARTRYLFEFRRDEMENQARIWPDSAVSSRLNALDRTWEMLENRYSASDRLFGISFDVPVALVGLVILLVLAWRRGIVSPTSAAVLLCGAQGALILGGLRVDFDRYYLPIVFAFAIGIGVTASIAWSLVVTAVAKIRARDSREIAISRPESPRIPSGQNA
jgi:hypothetical protein